MTGDFGLTLCHEIETFFVSMTEPRARLGLSQVPGRNAEARRASKHDAPEGMKNLTAVRKSPVKKYDQAVNSPNIRAHRKGEAHGDSNIVRPAAASSRARQRPGSQTCLCILERFVE